MAADHDRPAREGRTVRGPPSVEPERSLTFPDLPRLELDDLLRRLVGRAEEVLGTQGRLRGLLRANQMISGDLTLPVLLRHVVEVARELVGARYAALGVTDRTGGLAEFVHTGMPAATVAGIAHLPQGKGLLGAIIEEPVPIRVRGEVFGNLYLCESTHGEFSTEDEELLEALAATAGVAIANARLYDVARSRQDWLRASAAITRRLLSDEPGDPLHQVVEQARDVAEADLVALARPADGGAGLLVEVAVGIAADALVGVTIPVEGSLCGRVLLTGAPLRDSWPREGPGLGNVVAAELALVPVLIVPLIGTRQVDGVLIAARVRDRPAFTDDDLDMCTGFADQVSLALELTGSRAEQQRTAVLDDRDRILGTIGDLDDTITQIRITIFQLQHLVGGSESDLRGRVLDVVDDGIGPQTTRRSGLANLQARAERHGGTLSVLPNDPAGTRLSWSVPIP